ncbi:MAG: hypothetical protein K2X29_05650 [Candidatus Obscuribacterales bacterium]|jgi:hypothetical protein|nr:hypothetical protein [Candidatus Obscuribacterales bacterium]
MKVTVQDQINKMRRVGKSLNESSSRREERRKAMSEDEQVDSVITNRFSLTGALSPILNRLNMAIGAKAQGHSHWFPKG